MQDLRIALVQADQIWQNVDGNLSNYNNLLSSVSNVDLILLPEMFQTGFSMHPENLSEEMENSQSLLWLKDLAKEKDAAVYTSLMIRENGAYYNRGVFVEPEGKITSYDKRKCFGLAGEDKIFTAGKNEVIVEYKNWKIQLQICYDLRFPEIVRNRIDETGNAAYDLILYVANWPERRAEHWKTLLKARAIENQTYVAAVNRVGTDGKDLSYSGDSVIISALGTEDKADLKREYVKTGTISKSVLSEIREMLPFLKDR